MKTVANRMYYSVETEQAMKCFRCDSGEYDIYWLRIARELNSSDCRAADELASILKDHFIRNNPVMTGIEEQYKEFWNVMINCIIYKIEWEAIANEILAIAKTEQ